MIKFSNIWRILPFYGFLHEWKILMVRMNKLTKNIWEENEEAFINWGKNYRATSLITVKNTKWAYEIAENHRFFKEITLTNKFLDKHFVKVIDNLKENKWTITNPSSESIDWWSILICKNDEAQYFLPWMMWNEYKPIEKFFNTLDSEFQSFIEENTSSGIIINKIDSIIQVIIYISPVLRYTCDAVLNKMLYIKSNYQHFAIWKNHNCDWRPRSVISNDWIKNTTKYIIKQKLFYNLKEFVFLNSNREDFQYFWTALKTLKEFKHVSIKFKEFGFKDQVKSF